MTEQVRFIINMDEHTLRYMLFSLVNSTNICVFSYDECLRFLQSYNKLDTYYIIFNSEPRSDPGEHWLALYIYGNKVIEFFDSYGETFGVLEVQYGSLYDVLKRHGFKIRHRSLIQVQDYESSLCGVHCLFFLTLRYMDVSFKDIYIKVYRWNNPVICDSLVENFLKIFFISDKNNYYYKTHEQTCSSLKHYASRHCYKQATPIFKTFQTIT